MSNQKIVTEAALSALASDIKTALSGKANSNDVYPKSQTYNRTEIDNALELKADKSELYNVYPTEQESGAIAHFTDGADNIPVKSLVSQIVAFESGNGQPKSPTNPYSISGFDSGVITRCGKNLIDETQFVQGSISGAGADSVSYTRLRSPLTKVKPNTAYAFATNSALLVFEIHEYDKNGIWLQYTSINQTSGTITTTANTEYVKILIRNSTNTPITVDELTTFQMEIGTATTYEAYNGNTYTFAFGQTVYGGHFDNKGNLVVTRVEIIFNGSENWQTNGDKGVYISTSRIPNIDTTKPISFEEYQTIANGQAPANDGKANYNNARTAIQIHDERGMTDANYKTFLANHNIKMVYALANPITLSITSQDIPTLLGENNIFSNTGDVEVDYHADIGLYIDKKISSLAQG